MTLPYTQIPKLIEDTRPLNDFYPSFDQRQDPIRQDLWNEVFRLCVQNRNFDIKYRSGKELQKPITWIRQIYDAIEQLPEDHKPKWENVWLSPEHTHYMLHENPKFISGIAFYWLKENSLKYRRVLLNYWKKEVVKHYGRGKTSLWEYHWNRISDKSTAQDLIKVEFYTRLESKHATLGDIRAYIAELPKTKDGFSKFCTLWDMLQSHPQRCHWKAYFRGRAQDWKPCHRKGYQNQMSSLNFARVAQIDKILDLSYSKAPETFPNIEFVVIGSTLTGIIPHFAQSNLKKMYPNLKGIYISKNLHNPKRTELLGTLKRVSGQPLELMIGFMPHEALENYPKVTFNVTTHQFNKRVNE